MSDYRLLELAASKRLLENANGYINEGAFIGDRTTGTLTLSGTKVETYHQFIGAVIARAHVAGFRLIGPLPNVAAHILLTSRMEKLSSAPSRHQVVFLAGGGGLETSWQGGSDTNPSEVGDALRDCAERYVYRHRIITLPTNWTWGDDEMITRIDDALTYAEAQYGFNPPYHFVGVSMGTPCAMNWAVNNLDKVRSIACMLPAVNIQEIVDDNLANTGAVAPPNVYPPNHGTAYGVRPPDSHNPASYAADLSGIPIKLWYSNNDTICLPAEVVSFAADSGAETVNIGNQTVFGIPGHGLDTGFTSTDVATFLTAND